MLPDAEAILSRYLREYPGIESLGASVVPRTPSDTLAPWVRVTQLDASAVGGSRTEHLIEWLGQFDCYAGDGGQEEASLLTRTVREALSLAHEAEHEGAVITGARFVSCPRLPDGDHFEPARERYALTTIVWLHP